MEKTKNSYLPKYDGSKNTSGQIDPICTCRMCIPEELNFATI